MERSEKTRLGKKRYWLLGAVVLAVMICASLVAIILTMVNAGRTGKGALGFLAAPTPTQTATSTKTTTPAQTSTPAQTATPIPTPTPQAGESRVWQVDGMVGLYVPAGKFTMGSNDGDDEEKPLHTVYLDGYWIDQTEVTNAMYDQCVAAGACTAPGNTTSNTRDSYYGSSQYADYPVVNVDWFQSLAYCEWAGRRLPTEAEWEKAARGTDGRQYPWGNEQPTCSLANYNYCLDDTSAVGSYAAGASAYGALDMAGNVWEWVADWYDVDYYAKSPESNPTGPSSGSSRALRGGSWLNLEWVIRTSYRGRGVPDYWSFNGGFRCARVTSQ